MLTYSKVFEYKIPSQVHILRTQCAQHPKALKRIFRGFVAVLNHSLTTHEELRDPPASASSVLKRKVCITTPVFWFYHQCSRTFQRIYQGAERWLKG